MPSLLLRGLRATTAPSTSTASYNQKRAPDRPLLTTSSPLSPTRHSSVAVPTAETGSVPIAIGHSSSNSGSATYIPHDSSSPVAAFKRRLAHSVSGLSIKYRAGRKDRKSSVKDQVETTNVAKAITSKSSIDQGSRSDPLGCLVPESVGPAQESTSKASTASSTLSSSDLEPLHLSVRKKQRQRQSLRGYLHKSISHRHTFIKMATDNAQPPVSYSRLQEITTSACEKALGSVTSYNHASTEDWNTTIINTILGTLVEETTPKQSETGNSQPPFKYVVNSTIIQHAPVSSSGPTDPTLTGRRGMHAASGAFWSNEKDGMWSYKYSAAEKKGLDVVVGVIWIHVG